VAELADEVGLVGVAGLGGDAGPGLVVVEVQAFDFTGYKSSTLLRRVRKRMQTVDSDSFESYRDFLDANRDEFTELFNTILINVTSFFRDPAAWDHIAEEVIASLLTSGREPRSIRCWSAGCASARNR
jgi:two-component system, chemotaxis family, CheB/CheR fusion protein